MANDSHNPADPGVAGAGLDIRQLVADHHTVVYRYAFRLAGNAADAEDLSQQTFLLAQQKLHQLREVEKVRSWLLAICRSCFLKICRKKQPTPAANLEMDMQSIPGRLPTGEDIDEEALQAALAEMPDEFRLVLVMFYFEEYSYKEIAAEMDIAIGTVMSRLSRAKKQLRERLTAKVGQS